MSSNQSSVQRYGIYFHQNPKRLLGCYAFFFVVGDIRYNNFSFILEGTEVAQLVKNLPLPADSVLPDLLHTLNTVSRVTTQKPEPEVTCPRSPW